MYAIRSYYEAKNPIFTDGINPFEEETPTETPAPVCDQACQDEHVAYGLVDVFWFIWNQNIAGQPEGSKDFTVAGPQGGTVHVTRITSYNVCYTKLLRLKH